MSICAPYPQKVICEVESILLHAYPNVRRIVSRYGVGECDEGGFSLVHGIALAVGSIAASAICAVV
jgi:hypothetical protein